MFIRLLLLRNRLQYAGLNKLTSICSIIVLLNVLSPTTSGFKTSDTYKTILSSCDLELSRCPMDSDSVETRRVCMNNYKGCRGGTSYLCGEDTTDRYIVETCQPSFSCQPGTSFQYVVTFTAGQPEAHLECVPCPGDRFEPERTNSSLTSITAGCTYVHVPQDNLSSHLVLFERGSKSKPSLYVCDYENNYHERNGIVFVDDIPTHTYDCVEKLCPIGALLHPDGSCIDCETKLVPEDNFICYNRLGKKPLGTANMDASQEKDGTKVLVPAIVVPVLIVLAFILAAVCFVRWRRRRRGNVNDRVNDRENPTEQPLINTNGEQHHNAEPPDTNTNKASTSFNNSTIGANIQGHTIHINGSIIVNGDKVMPETSDNHTSSKVEDEEGQKSHLKMKPLNFHTSLEDLQTDPSMV